MTRKLSLAAMGIASMLALSAGARAQQHNTDGAFGTNEWTPRPSVGSGAFNFNPSTNRGGAVLYVEQTANGGLGDAKRLGDRLNLMYDYASSQAVLGAGANPSNSSIDIFFEVPQDADYAVHITGSGFAAFEKPNATPSPENGDGTLHFMNPDGSPFGPWTALDSDDLTNADFHAVLGFGPSPNNGAPHLIAEFDLTIADPNDPAGSGLYSPDPAFWSASGKHGTVDPPISSEIFQLRPDGTTFTEQILDTLGDPVAQPSDLPEPASLSILAIGAMFIGRRRR